MFALFTESAGAHWLFCAVLLVSNCRESPRQIVILLIVLSDGCVFTVMVTVSFAVHALEPVPVTTKVCVPLPVNTGFAVEELLRFVEGDQE